MASNLREINILTSSSGVEEKWRGEDVREGRRRRREDGKETEKEDELVFNSVWLSVWSKG